MASARYTLNIDPKDLVPEKPRELTPREKAANWWHYHWKLLLGIGIALGLATMGIVEIVTQEKADYQVGIVSRFAVDEQICVKLEEGFQKLPSAKDVNGDGKVIVDVLTYQLDMRPQEEISEDEMMLGQDPMVNIASQTRLAGDIQTGTLGILLSDDPERLQVITGIVADENNQILKDRESLEGGDIYRWADCPVLTGLDLGGYTDIAGNVHDIQAFCSELTLVRRAEYDGKPEPEAAAANWDLFRDMTKGAVRP